MIFEFLDNKYVSSFLTLMIVLYATFLGPELPPVVKELFNNTLFRMFILFLVVVKGNTNPSLGLVIAIAFILTMDYLYVADSQEAFRQCEEYEFPESHGCTREAFYQEGGEMVGGEMVGDDGEMVGDDGEMIGDEDEMDEDEMGEDEMDEDEMGEDEMGEEYVEGEEYGKYVEGEMGETDKPEYFENQRQCEEWEDPEEDDCDAPEYFQ